MSNHKSFTRFAAMLAVGLAGASPAAAAVVYDSATYVTQARALGNLESPGTTVVTANTPTIFTEPFGLSTPTTGYTGPAILGGYTLTFTSSVGGNFGDGKRVVDNDIASTNLGVRDVIAVQIDNKTGGNVNLSDISFRGAIAVPLGASVEYAEVDEATFGMRNARLTLTNGLSNRLIVREAGTENYFVSNTVQSFGSDNSTVKEQVVEFAAQTWAPLNTGTFTYGSFAAPEFDAVDAMGWYSEGSRTAEVTRSNHQSVAQFSAATLNYTLVPEPASLALVATASGAAMLRRRHGNGC